MNERHDVDSLFSWVICLSAGLFFFYEFLQLNLFDVLNPILRHELNLNASKVSMLSSAFIWANTLFLIPAGILLDRFSVKKIILLTLLLCILGILLIFISHSLFLMYLGRFLTGIGNAFCFVACVILISRWFSQEKKGLVVGITVTLAFIGGLLAHTPFAYLLKIISWRVALLCDLIVGVVIFLWLLYWIEDAPKGFCKAKEDSAKPFIKKFFAVVKRPQIYLAGCYTALLNLPILVFCALWGISYLKIEYALSTIAASNIVSGLFFGSLIGCPLLGYLSDKKGKRKPIMWLGIIGTALTLLLIIFINLHIPALLFLLFVSLGFFSAAQVLSYPLLAEINPPSQVGEATAIASCIIMGSGAWAQILFAFLVELKRGNEVSAYLKTDFQYAVWIFPSAILLAAIVLSKIKETNCKQYGES